MDLSNALDYLEEVQDNLNSIERSNIPLNCAFAIRDILDKIEIAQNALEARLEYEEEVSE